MHKIYGYFMKTKITFQNMSKIIFLSTSLLHYCYFVGTHTINVWFNFCQSELMKSCLNDFERISLMTL